MREPIYIGDSLESGRPIYSRLEVPGIATFGGPGTGKSSLLMRNLLTYPKSVGVFSDSNAELACVTGRRRKDFGKVYQINAFELFCKSYLEDIPSIGYNPMACLAPHSPKFGVRASKLAASLVPKNPQAREPYFDETAHSLVQSAIMAEAWKNESPYLPTVAEKLSGNIQAYAKDCVANVEVPEVQARMRRYTEDEADKSLRGVIETTRTHVDFLLDTCIGKCLTKDDGFSFTQLQKEVVTVYVILPLDVVGVLGKFFKLILASCLTELFDEEED
jgi:type IV secretory pathway TraG/TraD family ATPase VirD4